MTAGLHHRWRERAADLARVSARAAACSTSRPAPATWRSSSRGASPPTARSSAATSPRRCSRARAQGRKPRRAAELRFEWADALALPYADDASTPPPSASAHATSPTSRAAWREMARVVRPGGRVVVLEITTPTRPPLSLFYRLWFDRVVPLLGRASRGDDPGDATTLPAELGQALPGAGGLAGGCSSARACARSATC